MSETPEPAGARRRADIAPKTLRELNRGMRESRTLVEALAVDFAELISHAVPGAKPLAAELRRAAGEGITKRMLLAGRLLHRHLGEEACDRLRRHPSDTVRGWAAFALAAVPRYALPDLVPRMRPLADDEHFGVREWAWLALRPRVVAEIRVAVRELLPFTDELSDNLRRFAVEATRPRGVWSAHCRELIEDPEIGIPLLEPLQTDPSRYVQDSCANWLNDAARSQPAWVKALCRRWLDESDTPATHYIVRRALRRQA